MTPEALRRRMVHGNVYPPDRIEAALTHYFRPGNLTALRELALLWVANRVEEGLQRYRAEHGIASPWETNERIIVGISGDASDAALIRRAGRIAARTPGSELIAVHIRPDDGVTTGSCAMTEQRALVAAAGGSFQQVTITPATGDTNVAPGQGITVTAYRHGRIERVSVRSAGDPVTGSLGPGGSIWQSEWTLGRVAALHGDGDGGRPGRASPSLPRARSARSRRARRSATEFFEAYHLRYGVACRSA